MEDPASLLTRHSELLKPESLSAQSDPDEGAVIWRRYVADEVERMLAAGVNPRFQNSWMLRKGIRAHLPLGTLARMYRADKNAKEWPDHRDNRSEAVRYAVLDGRLTDEMLALFSHTAHGFAPELYLVLFAGAAHNWSVAFSAARAILVVDQALYAVAISLLDLLGFPRGISSDFDIAPRLVSDRERLAELAESILNSALQSDDADNILSVDGFDVRNVGIPVDHATAATAPAMAPWVGGNDNYAGDSYVAALGQVIAQRFANFRVVGAGAYGIVFTADRDGKRYAIKVTRLADPLGKTTQADRHLVESELAINLAIANNPELRAEMQFFPWVEDWTRGRMDVVRTLETMTGSRDVRKKLLIPGAGVYLAQVMPAFDFTLDAWLNAANQAAGTNSDAYEVFARMLLAMMTALLLQLAVLRHRLPGFKHTDIKSNNVLLHRMAPGDDLNRPLIRFSFPSGHLVWVSHNETGGYAPSLSDVGLASISYPPLGRVDRDNTDFSALANMMPLDWPPTPWVMLANLRRALNTQADAGDADSIGRVLSKWGELSKAGS